MKVLTKGDVVLAREVDKDVKNKFRHVWLETVVKICSKKLGTLETKLSDCIDKVDIAGKALCSYCNDVISYGGKGKVALTDHVKSEKHIRVIEHKRTNYTLGAQFSKKSESPLFPLFKHSKTAPANSVSSSSSSGDSSVSGLTGTTSASSADRLIPLDDRTKNMEAMILSVMAENNVSFAVAPHMVKLIKECSRDPKALEKVCLDRCTAAYKLKYGLAEYFQNCIISCMRECPFSLNIDEATSANNKKVLAVLVSYFSPVKKEVVVEHLASIELVKTDSLSIFEAVKELIESNDIPWTNLQSCLMDSCNVMRGGKSGFETRLRQLAPHLLDINGDSCHHVHNSVKKFCEPFDNWVERLFHDLHTDFKWSSESKELMSELCFLFDIKYTIQARFIPHRWLSAYDITLSTLRLYNMYKLFYFPFVKNQQQHKKDVQAIIDKLPNNQTQMRVHSIMEMLKLKFKTMTKEGRLRKERIVERVFTQGIKTSLILNFYASALPMLKEYVCLFQTQEPMIHKLHDAQIETTRKFLASFVKAEKLVDLSAKQLVSLDVGSVENNLDLSQLFIGKKTRDLLKSYNQKNEFLMNASRAYRHCARHLLKTLPLTNKLIVSLSALDPEAPCHSLVTKSLNCLISHFSHYLSSQESETAAVEIKNFTSTRKGKEFNKERADVWWNKQMDYPVLQKLSRACLSIFHGPQVEGSFSTMKDILKTKSGNMLISTFSAIQTVKYSLRSRNTRAVECFQRKDVLHTPVDPALVKAIRDSASKHKKHRQKQTELLALKRKRLDMALTTITSKAQSKAFREKAVKRAYHTHTKQMNKSHSGGGPPPPKKRRL